MDKLEACPPSQARCLTSKRVAELGPPVFKLSSDLDNAYAPGVTTEGSGDLADATLREFASGQKLFGRYTLIKILGRGGMGIVWLARDEELEREVALKFLPNLIIHDRAMLTELKRETRRSLELTHQNIVRIYDFVNDERSACISMEYIDGDTLGNMRCDKPNKVFEPFELSAWTSQLCDALEYAHRRVRIIHRDLKPANLMVNQRGELKISDFGISRSLGDTISRLTREEGRSGTLVYMSPQQLGGERGSHLDDIYSLGASLYELLTTKPPFYSGNIDRQIREKVPPSMTARRKEFEIEAGPIPPEWEEMVAACLAKDPAKRPQTTSEMARRLQAGGPTPTHKTAEISSKRSKKILVPVAVAALCLIAFGAWYFGIFKTRERRQVQSASAPSNSIESTRNVSGPAASDKSIAVLPLENLSEEKENAFFADGIQDDILTSLAKISDLKVISRTSVMQYRGAGAVRNLRDIARALGVENILEGSVRRSGNRVLVNVQLIDARHDRHIWAERYDRTIADSIGLQGELATEIASALRAKLAPEEKARLEAKPTDNPGAYALYLRALGHERALNHSTEDTIAAEHLYAEAIALDPKFALAHARLSIVNSYLAAGGPSDNRALRAKARSAAEEVLRLSPSLAEAHMALGLCLYWADKDYAAALKEFSIAEKTSPNEPDIFQYMAGIYRRQGRWRESVATYERAQALDPRNLEVITRAALDHVLVREWAAATACYNRALEIASDSAEARIGLAYLEVFRNANPAAGRKILQKIPAGIDPDGRVICARWDLAMIERDYAVAEKILKDFPLEDFPHAGDTPKTYYMGRVALARGEVESAQRYFAATTPAIERWVRDEPDDAERHAQLGLLYAYMHRKEDAIREGRRAVELEPESQNAFHGANVAANLALLYALDGEPDQAITLIERLLSTPGPVGWPDFPPNMTLSDLRLRWEWDPLRSNPRFQKILEGPEPKTIY